MFVHVIKAALATVEKVPKKEEGEKKKKALESGVCGNRARKPFISELVIQNIKNPIS